MQRSVNFNGLMYVSTLPIQSVRAQSTRIRNGHNNKNNRRKELKKIYNIVNGIIII